MPVKKFREIVGGKNYDQEMDREDFEMLTSAELEILHTIGFDLEVETPWMYFNKWKVTFCQMHTPEETELICNRALVDLCLVLSSDIYLDIPAEVTAAAAAEESLSGVVIPPGTMEWLKSVRDLYGESVFTKVRTTIDERRKRTRKQRK